MPWVILVAFLCTFLSSTNNIEKQYNFLCVPSFSHCCYFYISNYILKRHFKDFLQVTEQIPLVNVCAECTPLKSFLFFFFFLFILQFIQLQLHKSHRDEKYAGDNSQSGQILTFISIYLYSFKYVAKPFAGISRSCLCSVHLMAKWVYIIKGAGPCLMLVDHCTARTTCHCFCTILNVSHYPFVAFIYGTVLIVNVTAIVILMDLIPSMWKLALFHCLN